ncbi:hypothetical protein PENSPDRAFT_636336 [Peniophora sp. CONT]|nr:hypothetical protein PENSPDRAFT_636336 [Peniophora sp. CONT]
MRHIIQAVTSDTIVLWRVWIVWNKARPVFILGAAVLITTFGLNIASIATDAGLTLHGDSRRVSYNDNDSETFVIYGETSIGLAAAFVSLASNLCATALVALKIWLHRRKFAMHVRTGNRRTVVERVMELLVDSGVVYTAIWLLYCISFYRPITSQTVLGPASAFADRVTAVDYLDAAMAQITMRQQSKFCRATI